MSQQPLTLPATGPRAGEPRGRRRLLLEIAGAVAIAATYVYLVLTQPVELADGPTSASVSRKVSSITNVQSARPSPWYTGTSGRIALMRPPSCAFSTG